MSVRKRRIVVELFPDLDDYVAPLRAIRPRTMTSNLFLSASSFPSVPLTTVASSFFSRSTLLFLLLPLSLLLTVLVNL